MTKRKPVASDPAYPNSKYIARPWTFKFEMSKGCNLKCFFCPVHAMPDLQDAGQRQFMTPDRMAAIAASCNELNPEPRIELTLRGEPTLNPYLLDNIRAMRQHMPKAQITLFTNGIRFFKEDPGLGLRLLEAGLNILCVDCYNNTYDRFTGWAEEHVVRASNGTVQVQDFRTFSAYAKHSKGYRLKTVVLVPDLAASLEGKPLVAVRVIHNVAGNADAGQLEKRFGIKPLAAPLVKNCARPYREFIVFWDGTVGLCCNDWRAECVLGHMPAQSAKDVWYGDFHLAVMRSLYAKDRSGVPCNKCDYKGGYRLGLLKNPVTGE